MRVGDIIVNPYVREYFDDKKPNPMYKSMIIHIGSKYTTTLRYDGETSEYFTRDVREWKVLRNIDLGKMILNTKDKNFITCDDCILAGTDACSRGAGRAVDDEICESFMEGENND